MARILLLYPNRWGRGITAIWIASHAGVLRSRGHEVKLFDCTFYREWTNNETRYNTQNMQYRPTDYENLVQWRDGEPKTDLQNVVDAFKPDIVFWGSISSHIHGEGEYVNTQYGYDLMSAVRTSALMIAGGLQPTTAPAETLQRFPKIDYLIRGETELVLAQIAESISKGLGIRHICGLVFKDDDGKVVVNEPQPIIRDLDQIAPYDYSLFEDQVFLRPYNGHIVRAVDYELSRGCVFTCSYCVETVIQRYYGFDKQAQRGVLQRAGDYVRHKSAKIAFEEISRLYHDYGVTLFRCQDTNFLTVSRPMLNELAELIHGANLPIMLYIETRPEGITDDTVRLLKKLRVDGVGMGIELAAQEFRERNLNRFSDQEKIVRAFKILRDAGIKRTAYNVIGFPGEDEHAIIETLEFNRKLDPDNITVAFYTPYVGTGQQVKGVEEGYFNDYEFDLDAQLRTASRHPRMSKKLLEFYKTHFVNLSRMGTTSLAKMKAEAG